MKTLKVKEAKQKICPFMSDNTMGRDYNGNYNGVSYCVCSDCMAWEFVPNNTYDNLSDRSLNELINISKDLGISFGDTTTKYQLISSIKEQEQEGFCRRLA